MKRYLASTPKRCFHLLAHFWVKHHHHQVLIVSQLWYDFGFKHMVPNKPYFFNVRSQPCFEPRWCPMTHVFSSSATQTLGCSFKSEQQLDYFFIFRQCLKSSGLSELTLNNGNRLQFSFCNIPGFLQNVLRESTFLKRLLLRIIIYSVFYF